jgi:hypothetical protein
VANLHDACVPVFDATLDNLSVMLGRASAHCADRNIDPAALLQARLFPDMFPLTRQVQIACDAAKLGCARLAGVDAPKHADDETSFEALAARIASTRAFIASVPREKFEGSAERRIEVPTRAQTYAFDGQTFLLRWAMPNFYFHVVTAYDLLRHNGVEIGKRDYLGTVPQLSA